MVGEFVELDPPNHLVFTWGWEGDEDVPPGSSTVASPSGVSVTSTVLEPGGTSSSPSHPT